MNHPADTRLSQDSCSYSEKLKRTTGPGLYSLNMPYNDCGDCKRLPDDPALRFQAYGPNTCTMKSAVDDSSELLGLNYKMSKCNQDQYLPNSYSAKSGCIVSAGGNPRQCLAPREDTRLSNPPSTLRGTGINRWEWLRCDPQATALEAFDRIPVNYRMVAKDNHVPIFELPLEMCAEIKENANIDYSDNLKKWQTGSARDMYAPGNPQGYINYNAKCNS
jgi:hypothetical protein